MAGEVTPIPRCVGQRDMYGTMPSSFYFFILFLGDQRTFSNAFATWSKAFPNSCFPEIPRVCGEHLPTCFGSRSQCPWVN